MIQNEFARIMSLKDGTKKMSKSDPSEMSRINLNDSKEEIENKIKKAKTDALALPDNIKELENRPEDKNLLGIYSSLNNQEINKTIKEFSGKSFSEFKKKLSEIAIEKIYPISLEMSKLKKDFTFIDSVLTDGNAKADTISSKKVSEIKKIIGF